MADNQIREKIQKEGGKLDCDRKLLFRKQLQEFDEKVENISSKLNKVTVSFLRNKIQNLLDIYNEAECEVADLKGTLKVLQPMATKLTETQEKIVDMQTIIVDKLDNIQPQNLTSFFETQSKIIQKIDQPSPLLINVISKQDDITKKLDTLLKKVCETQQEFPNLPIPKSSFPHESSSNITSTYSRILNSQNIDKQIKSTLQAKTTTFLTSISGKADPVQIHEALNTLLESHDKINFNQIRNLKNGNLLVETATTEETASLHTLIQSSSTIKILPRRTRQPKIIIYNIDHNLLEKETLEDIHERNFKSTTKEKFLSNVKLLFRIHLKDKIHEHWVLEINSAFWKLFNGKNKMYVHNTRLNIDEYSTPSRCKQCLKYGHTFVGCVEADQFCGKCSGKGHSFDKCTSTTFKCINCIRGKFKESDCLHSANDFKCNMLKIAKLKERSITDYGIC